MKREEKEMEKRATFEEFCYYLETDEYFRDTCLWLMQLPEEKKHWFVQTLYEKAKAEGEL